MKQLPASKKRKLFSALKKYKRRYLGEKYSELDEAATRLMVNAFLTDLLGFASLDEVKTEYMIRGTYADYVIQIRGKRYFIIEVKKFPTELSQKHLRQAVNYAANEGIDWALLTNGKNFDFYKILFNKPIESRRVFSIDLGDESKLKSAAEYLQYLTKPLLLKKGLDYLWNKVSALDPVNLSRLLYEKPILRRLRRQLRRTYKAKFSDEEIATALTRIIEDKIESVKPSQKRHKRRRTKEFRNLQIDTKLPLRKTRFQSVTGIQPEIAPSAN